MTCHTNSLFCVSQSRTKNTGCLGFFSTNLSPPCFCAASYALSLSILRNPRSKTWAELLFGFQLSSAEKVMPSSGASGPTNPDHKNNFIMRSEGEANEPLHMPALPSLAGASAENCDCSRNGCASAAHPRAERYIFWNDTRPVWYSAGFDGAFDVDEIQDCSPASYLGSRQRAATMRDTR